VVTVSKVPASFFRVILKGGQLGKLLKDFGVPRGSYTLNRCYGAGGGIAGAGEGLAVLIPISTYKRRQPLYLQYHTTGS